jgi:hypothetical protein
MGRRGWAVVAASLDILPSTPGWEGWDVTVNSMGGERCAGQLCCLPRPGCVGGDAGCRGGGRM